MFLLEICRLLSDMKPVLKKSIFFPLFFILFSFGFIFPQTVHEVKKGETLYSISKKYNVSIDSISKVNKIEGNGIKTGQKLIIPAEGYKEKQENSAKKTDGEKKLQEHIVEKGETWYGIAKASGISLDELYSLNKTDGSTGLKTGQKIYIPKKTENAVTDVKKEIAATEKKENVPAVEIPVDAHKFSGKKGDSNLVWPVKKPEVDYINGKVSGVALSAEKNEAVTAIKSGTVMFSGAYRGFGNVVFIQSKTGHIYAYTGLGKVTVSKGEYIDFGNQIGTAGIDSYTSRSQISLMVFQNGLPIDPARAPRG